jgi:choline-sulfatase
VRWGRWLYMRTYHDGFHLFPKEMLYDVVGDPHEQHDVASENPALCHEAVYRLTEWHDRMMATLPAPYETDPLWTVLREGGPCHARGQLARYCEYLKKTGRAWAIPELQKRHPGEFA